MADPRRIAPGLLPSCALALLAAAAPAGCAGGGSGTDGGSTCTTDLDCDDGHECTIDSCGVGGLCRYDEVNERCPAGQVCETGRGCVGSASCSSDADCDDGHACTIDSCGVGGICNHNPVDERCGPGEVCSRDTGCTVPPGCRSDADCDDAVACTRDSCGVDMSCRNMPLNELCASGERCHQSRGCFLPMPCTTAADCQDGDFCNGDEICDPEFGCAPAEAPRACNDSMDCTMDSCDPSLPGTGGQMGQCVFTCDRSRPACMCPVEPPTCTGTFDITSSMPLTGGCTGGVFCTSFPMWDFTQATFSVDASGTLVIRPRRLSTMGFPVLEMTDGAPPICPMFAAEALSEGGCSEAYRMRGTFSDADNLSGEIEVEFIDNDGFSCSACGCIPGRRTMAYTGRRAP